MDTPTKDIIDGKLVVLVGLATQARNTYRDGLPGTSRDCLRQIEALAPKIIKQICDEVSP